MKNNLLEVQTIQCIIIQERQAVFTLYTSLHAGVPATRNERRGEWGEGEKERLPPP